MLKERIGVFVVEEEEGEGRKGRGKKEARAKRQSAALTGTRLYCSRRTGLGFFCCFRREAGFFLEDGHGQVLLAEQAQKIKLQRFPEAAGRPLAQVQLDQYRCDQRQVKLERHPLRRFR